mgnify:FL=1
MTNNKYPDIQLANFRELGGYRNTDGYTVKDNKIFRSPCLADLSEQTKQALDGLGIEYVLDFRSKAEADGAPDYVPKGATYLHLPAARTRGKMVVNPKDVARMIPRWAGPKLSIGVFRLRFRHLYRKFPFKNSAYRKMFEIMNGGSTFLVHCSAGKDRTGVACMLILLAFGVPYDVIERDYLLSNELRKDVNAEYEKQFVVYPHYETMKQIFEVALNVSPDLLRAAYDKILRKYGSVEEYFLQEYGADKARLELWRSQYMSK